MAFKKNSIKVNAALNSIQTLMSMIFPLITFPYISRILLAENIGKVNFGNSIISYFSLIAVFGIANYATREGAIIRDNRDKFNVFACEMFSMQTICMIFSYVCFFVALLLSKKLQEYNILLIIQSLVLPMSALNCSWILVVFEDFLYSTVRGILMQLLSVILMLIFVKTQNDYLIYAAITVFSSGIGTLFNIKRASRYCRLRFKLQLNVRLHIRSLITFFISNLTTTIYVSSDTTMLGVLCDNISVGIYSSASKIYTLVKQLLNATITVTAPRLINLYEKDYKGYLNLLEIIINNILLMAIPATAGLILLNVQLIDTISGPTYIQGSMALAILAGALLFSILANALFQSVLMPKKLENIMTRAAVVSAMTNIGLNIVLISIYKQNAAAFTTLLAELIVLIFGIAYSSEEINKIKWKKTCSHAITGTISFTIFICYFKNKVVANSFYTLIISIPMCIIIYGIVLLILHDSYFIQLIKVGSKKSLHK